MHSGLGLILNRNKSLFKGLLDKFSGASAAYSLRRLAKGEGKVVRVRRASDNAEQDFSAAALASGAMTDWVNADVVTYTSDFSAGVDGTSAINGTVDGNIDDIGGLDDCLRYTLDTTSSSNHSVRLITSLTIAASYSFSLDVYVPSGNNVVDGFRITNSGGDINDQYPSQTLDSWIRVTGSLTTSVENLQIRAMDGASTTVQDVTGTDVFYIRNVVITQTTADGHVKTWYDQSGNGNDAVQTTAANQPKIVDAGTYLGELSFDGTDDYLALTSNLTTQPYSTFATYSATADSSFIYSGASQPTAGRRLTGSYMLRHGVLLSAGTHPSTEILGTYFANSTTSEIFSNGVSIASGDAGNTDNTIEYVFGRPSNAFGGTAKEMIIYNTDQSDNRIAIEANIGDYYGITLS